MPLYQGLLSQRLAIWHEPMHTSRWKCFLDWCWAWSSKPMVRRVSVRTGGSIPLHFRQTPFRFHGLEIEGSWVVASGENKALRVANEELQKELDADLFAE